MASARGTHTGAYLAGARCIYPSPCKRGPLIGLSLVTIEEVASDQGNSHGGGGVSSRGRRYLSLPLSEGVPLIYRV